MTTLIGRCPRKTPAGVCNGNVVDYFGEHRCVQCGWVDYETVHDLPNPLPPAMRTREVRLVYTGGEKRWKAVTLKVRWKDRPKMTQFTKDPYYVPYASPECPFDGKGMTLSRARHRDVGDAAVFTCPDRHNVMLILDQYNEFSSWRFSGDSRYGTVAPKEA